MDALASSPTMGTPGVKLWSGTVTTVGGVATFYPTSDGTGSGTPYFAVIACAFPAAISNTGTVTAAPFCSIKAIAADRTNVTVNVGTGTILGLLGPTLLGAPDGTQVFLFIVGT